MSDTDATPASGQGGSEEHGHEATGTTQPRSGAAKSWFGTAKIKTAVVAAVAVVATAVVMGGGFALVQVASGGDSNDGDSNGGGTRSSAGRAAVPDDGQMAGGTRGGGGTRSLLSSALHGDVVVSDGQGGYTTQRFQTGEVTAVSETSLTAASEDGYTMTYVITTETKVNNGSEAIDKVETGYTVTIVATVAGSEATATTVTESDLDTGGKRGRQQRPSEAATD